MLCRAPKLDFFFLLHFCCAAPQLTELLEQAIDKLVRSRSSLVKSRSVSPNTRAAKNVWWNRLDCVIHFVWLVRVRKKILINIKFLQWKSIRLDGLAAVFWPCHIFVQLKKKVNFPWTCSSITSVLIRQTASKFKHIYIKPPTADLLTHLVFPVKKENGENGQDNV